MTRFAMVFMLALLSAGAALAQTAVAPQRMSRAALVEEVTRLRAIVESHGVTAERPSGCTSPESRQFDFWLGEWDVSETGKAEIVAESSITLHDQGCVVMEAWRPFAGGHGHSLNSYDARDAKWHQTWMDAQGRRSEYAGSFRDGAMYLDDVNGDGPGAVEGQRARMNYQALDANTVRQWGENFDPARNAWVVSWDLTYRRRAGER